MENTQTLEHGTVCQAHTCRRCITKKEVVFVRMGLPSLPEENSSLTRSEAKFQELRRRQSLKLMEKFELVFFNSAGDAEKRLIDLQVKIGLVFSEAAERGTTRLTTDNLMEALALKGIESKGAFCKSLIQDVALNLFDLGFHIHHHWCGDEKLDSSVKIPVANMSWPSFYEDINEPGFIKVESYSLYSIQEIDYSFESQYWNGVERCEFPHFESMKAKFFKGRGKPGSGAVYHGTCKTCQYWPGMLGSPYGEDCEGGSQEDFDKNIVRPAFARAVCSCSVKVK